ncbi:phospholipase C/P1 nuclease domain-containing protein [Catenaria anguillulae PL171]|uniref:Phospholipase C/P1 nuclease domain-containing protein n=1 Tax=Catenaria anguillulae PL171 TaxID=765915 RepID=A0A1Y2H9Q8_9FUNG|nr:phospholipase C/P1 nuclease domain-containing protein [Catenaria anguillulae PL171]
MTRLLLLPLLALFLLSTLGVPGANAWGREGHRAVANIAYGKLTPKAKASVDAILPGLNFTTIEDASTYPDEISRTPARAHTGKYHFVNIKDSPVEGTCGALDLGRDCPTAGCIITAIAKAAFVLSSTDLQKRAPQYGYSRRPIYDRCGNRLPGRSRTTKSCSSSTASASSTRAAPAPTQSASATDSIAPTPPAASTNPAPVDPPATQTSTGSAAPAPTTTGPLPDIDIRLKAEALAFAIHLVGDVSQPLHASDFKKGSNEVNVTFEGAATNLHSVWDTRVIRKTILTDHNNNTAAWVQSLLSLPIQVEDVTGIRCAGNLASGADIDKVVECASEWAQDSASMVCKDVYREGFKLGVDPTAEVGAAYYEQVKAQINEQVLKAGLRLSVFLNKLLN